MSAIQRLKAYEKWLKDYSWKGDTPQTINNPMSQWHHEKMPLDFGITDPLELEMAKKIRVKILGSKP